MSNIQFQGIVAVGNTRGQAVNRYRMLAMGKGATCFVDPVNNQAFISNASADMDNTFNPANGNIDLQQSEDALSGLQFEAKAGDVHEAFHTQCSDGCGVHLVFDSQSFVQNCPVCASSISSDGDDEEEVEDLNDDELDELDEEIEDEEEEEEEEESEEDNADDDSEAVASDDEDESDDDAEEDDESEHDDEDDHTDEDDSDDDSDDSEESEEEEEMSQDKPLVVAADSRDEAIAQFSRLSANRLTATASSAALVSADYKVCAGDEGCGAHVVAESEVTNCPQDNCGNTLSEPVEASTEDATVEPEAGVEGSADEGLETSIEPAADTQTAEASDEDETDDESEESDEEEEEATIGDDVSMSLIDETSESADEDEVGDEDDAEEEETAEEDLDTVEVDSFESLDDDVSIDDLDVSFSAAIQGQPAWTVYHQGRPVAMATASTIQKDHTDFFTTARFGATAIAASRIGGAKKILGELGFVGIKSQLRVSKHLEQRLQALASEQIESLQEENKQYAEAHAAALATAAVGITRGFFHGESNPVRESLCAALASTGVRSPEVIVDNALRGGFEAFLRQMFNRAEDIMSKPMEVQQSLSRTVLDTAYMPQTATASSATNLDNRLANFGTATASSDADNSNPGKTETAVAAAASDDFSARLGSVVGGLGKRR